MLFAHINQGSEESLVLSWELPPPNTKAFYFASIEVSLLKPLQIPCCQT